MPGRSVLLAVIRAFAMAEGGCGAPLEAPGFLEREDDIALA
jgi:hypothetical protein